MRLLYQLAFVTSILLGTRAYALEWICAYPQGHRVRITGLDISDALRGQVVNVGRSWVTVVMLPPDRPETVQALSALGVVPDAAWRIATTPPLRERTIVAVYHPAEVIDRVASNPPSAGYVPFYSGGLRNVAPCF